MLCAILGKVSTKKVKFRAKVYVAQKLMKISSGRELCYVNELLACLIMTNTMIIRNTAKCWDQVDNIRLLIMIEIKLFCFSKHFIIIYMNEDF